MKPLTASLVAGIAGGVVIIVASEAVGVSPLALLPLAALALLAWPVVCVRYYAPRQIYKQMHHALNPAWEPPAAAAPATHPVLTSLSEAAERYDWDALPGYLSKDFTLVDIRGRRFSSKIYVRAMRQYPRIYPDFQSQDELVLSDPARPDVYYVRQLQLGRPRSGPALDVTMWSRVELAPCGERVRLIGADAVVRAV
jgi:hypothetical protein